MIGISTLYLGATEPAHRLRYTATAHRRPVVVWNTTRRCNLDCLHCYAAASATADPSELSADEAQRLIDDLADFGVPVLLLSGGEPLLRPDLHDLAAYATSRGLRVVLSTNGTLIDAAAAARLMDSGVAYVGVSVDGLRDTHDRFRGQVGAFDAAMAGLRACIAAGLKVGLRFTITRRNAGDLPGLFDLVERERIPRLCVYHLVYSGRGSALMAEDLDYTAARSALDGIIDRTARLHARGVATEVLTVDNHADGPYLWLRMLREGNPAAARALELLGINGGNSSGAGIACVGWNGTVFPDQFWRTQPLGSVRARPFSAIWTDPRIPLLAHLRERARHLTGRCAHCRFLNLCGGNFRARAEAATGDIWASDPACYLTDEEIAGSPLPLAAARA